MSSKEKTLGKFAASKCDNLSNGDYYFDDNIVLSISDTKSQLTQNGIEISIDDFPSCRLYSKRGHLEVARWLGKNEKLSRLNGPAYIDYVLSYQNWFIDDVQYGEVGFKKKIAALQSNKTVKKSSPENTLGVFTASIGNDITELGLHYFDDNVILEVCKNVIVLSKDYNQISIDNFPSVTCINNDGKKLESFWQNGMKIHRENGPAHIVYDVHTGDVISEDYYLENLFYTKLFFDEKIKDMKKEKYKGSSKEKTLGVFTSEIAKEIAKTKNYGVYYFDDNVIFNHSKYVSFLSKKNRYISIDDYPSETHYDEEGNITKEYWRNDLGRLHRMDKPAFIDYVTNRSHYYLDNVELDYCIFVQKFKELKEKTMPIMKTFHEEIDYKVSDFDTYAPVSTGTNTLGPWSEQKVAMLCEITNTKEWIAYYFDNGIECHIDHHYHNISYQHNGRDATASKIITLAKNPKNRKKIIFPEPSIGEYSPEKLEGKDGIVYFDNGIFANIKKYENSATIFNCETQEIVTIYTNKSKNIANTKEFYTKNDFFANVNFSIPYEYDISIKQDGSICVENTIEKPVTKKTPIKAKNDKTKTLGKFDTKLANKLVVNATVGTHKFDDNVKLIINENFAFLEKDGIEQSIDDFPRYVEYKNGKIFSRSWGDKDYSLHRLIGPANVVTRNGKCIKNFYIKNIKYTKDVFNKKVALIKKEESGLNKPTLDKFNQKVSCINNEKEITMQDFAYTKTDCCTNFSEGSFHKLHASSTVENNLGAFSKEKVSFLLNSSNKKEELVVYYFNDNIKIYINHTTKVVEYYIYNTWVKEEVFLQALKKIEPNGNFNKVQLPKDNFSSSVEELIENLKKGIGDSNFKDEYNTPYLVKKGICNSIFKDEYNTHYFVKDNKIVLFKHLDYNKVDDPYHDHEHEHEHDYDIDIYDINEQSIETFRRDGWDYHTKSFYTKNKFIALCKKNIQYFKEVDSNDPAITYGYRLSFAKNSLIFKQLFSKEIGFDRDEFLNTSKAEHEETSENLIEDQDSEQVLEQELDNEQEPISNKLSLFEKIKEANVSAAKRNVSRLIFDVSHSAIAKAVTQTNNLPALLIIHSDPFKLALKAFLGFYLPSIEKFKDNSYIQDACYEFRVQSFEFMENKTLNALFNTMSDVMIKAFEDKSIMRIDELPEANDDFLDFQESENKKEMSL